MPLIFYEWFDSILDYVALSLKELRLFLTLYMGKDTNMPDRVIWYFNYKGTAAPYRVSDEDEVFDVSRNRYDTSIFEVNPVKVIEWV